MNELNSLGDYLAKMASQSTSASASCACEAKSNPAICETLERNRDRIADIETGMNKLLELLIGGETVDDEKIEPPTCLREEVTAQNIILGRIYHKLNMAYSALNG